MTMLNPEALAKAALEYAKKAAADGDLETAAEWLHTVPAASRPKDLVCAVSYGAAKAALAAGRWGDAIESLQTACASSTDPLFQRRLGLVRRRTGLLDDERWRTMGEAIDPAERLTEDALRPNVDLVWACGAYHSRHDRGSPWSVFLRMNKQPHELDQDVREAALRLSSSYLCRFIAERTEALRYADVVTAIPANPDRYANRGWSLPDELAKAIERTLALPYEPYALDLVDTDLELRGLSWSERRWRIRDAMRPGQLGLAKGRTVLVVDDVITSGATLVEAARQMLSGGVSNVYGVALCHTEG